VKYPVKRMKRPKEFSKLNGEETIGLEMVKGH